MFLDSNICAYQKTCWHPSGSCLNVDVFFPSVSLSVLHFSLLAQQSTLSWPQTGKRPCIANCGKNPNEMPTLICCINIQRMLLKPGQYRQMLHSWGLICWDDPYQTLNIVILRIIVGYKHACKLNYLSHSFRLLTGKWICFQAGRAGREVQLSGRGCLVGLCGTLSLWHLKGQRSNQMNTQH